MYRARRRPTASALFTQPTLLVPKTSATWRTNQPSHRSAVCVGEGGGGDGGAQSESAASVDAGVGGGGRFIAL